MNKWTGHMKSPPGRRAGADVEWLDASALESDPTTPVEVSVSENVRGAGVPAARGYRTGDVLAGKYELLRTLGEGGMAAVWVVQNLVLDAQFALKLIRNDWRDAHSTERVLKEARSAARIEHPAIIRMLDFGMTDRGDPFLVMELLSGVSIRDRLRSDGPFTPIEAVQLLLPIADGLSVAHAHGVVHRDLKPDNIVCVTEGVGRSQPKIIDFGIAKQLDQESTSLTQAGTVLGSPEYMSPEQARGLPDVDHRADIWALSVVLYEMVTGTTPFFRGGVAGVLRAIVEEPARPIADFGIDDPELWSIISRGLQKSPAARWDDMRSLGTALAEWLLRRGVEEDACAQSVRMVWLRGSSSAPPVAIDAHTHAELARAAALAEDYEIPKKGIFKTSLGIASAIFTVALIGAAGFVAMRASGFAAPMTTGQQPTPLFEPTSSLEPTTRSLDIPFPAVSIPAPSAGALEEAVEPTAAVEKPVVHATETPKARRRAPFVPYSAAQPEPAQGSGTSTAGVTALPEVKPPPEFGEKTSDNPYVDGGKAGGKASDNPYVDSTVGDKPSDNPYGDDKGSKPIDPSEQNKDESSPGF
jgi:eukaryotic-like serine/threonine-protein kinase